MNRKHLIVIYCLLLVVIGLQLFTLSRLARFQTDTVNVFSYFSEQIDVINGKLNALKNGG